MSAWQLLLLGCTMADPASADPTVALQVTPAATGEQLVRVSVSFPEGFLREGRRLVAVAGKRRIVADVRVLTRHPTTPPSVRRALVTFPFDFADTRPVRFNLALGRGAAEAGPSSSPAEWDGERLVITGLGGLLLTARPIAPERTSVDPPSIEMIESSPSFQWVRFRFADANWPRVLEVRRDCFGSVILIAHLQRQEAGFGYAPELGWELRASWDDPDALREGPLRCYDPTGALRKGRSLEEVHGELTWVTRLVTWTPEDKAPMQQASWRRAIAVMAPERLAPLTPTLQYPTEAHVDLRPDPFAGYPDLQGAVEYHHEAILRSVVHGVDWGNVTSYSDDAPSGAVQGMNRLNHCPTMFEEGYRTGDRRLVEAGVLWCDNMVDQSLWWGPEGTGGTRYNNLLAMGQPAPFDDTAYMWRSNSAVSFCTKGYDAFLLAYEETGDPRHREALEAQVAYASQHVHADTGEARNIGDVRDFVRLYEATGELRYLDEALRLFRELRTKLSTGDLFSQSGAPIVPAPPFIDEDDLGYRYPFAKPYIIGYALAGLPELARHAPEEPKLRDVVQAVADFLAESMDPLGGWRYPHPRSSHLSLSQAVEHAWQLVQADRCLGPQERHLDAIEAVLRQRIQAWRKTGRCLGSLSGWEYAVGEAKSPADLYARYPHPEDRDGSRDYTEGAISLGGSPPEGLVYFPEVLAYYLEHRPGERLLAPPAPAEPLGRVLNRLPGGSP